jgi:peptide/nickel transport system permease protein
VLFYSVKRVVHAAIVVWAVATVVFFIVRLVPGGPVAALLGPEYTAKAAVAMEHRLGLDQGLWVQYVTFLDHVVGPR